MALSTTDICRFLIAQQLLAPADLFAEGFVIAEAFRRNRNYKIFRNAQPSYVLKQASDAESRLTLAHEANIYRLLMAYQAQQSSKPVPQYYTFEAEHCLLVIEMQRGAHDLSEHSRRVARFSKGIARQIGRAVAFSHQIENPLALATSLQVNLSAQMPWVLTIHRPRPAEYARLSGGAIAVLRVVQQSASLCAGLDQLQQELTHDCLIHCDLKWDNCLIGPATSRLAQRVRLIDWEFGRLGDPAWDIGAMLANYLSWWLGSFPEFQAEITHAALEKAEVPLERMQPAVREFWNGYLAASPTYHPLRPALLNKAVRCAAARLIQTAFENSQYSAQLSRQVVALLQLAESILMRPVEATVQLLGIPVEG